jgi:hypothetical protein
MRLEKEKMKNDLEKKTENLRKSSESQRTMSARIRDLESQQVSYSQQIDHFQNEISEKNRLIEKLRSVPVTPPVSVPTKEEKRQRDRITSLEQELKQAQKKAREYDILLPIFNDVETNYAILKSRDNTYEEALSTKVTVLKHMINRGQGAAIQTGMSYALLNGAKYIVHFDADGQHNPLLIENFVDAILAGADIVIGVRSQLQRLSEKMFAIYAYARFGLKDPLCGLKAYRIEVYKEVGYFDNYGSIGTQLCLFGAKKGYKIDQIPFDVFERYGDSRFGLLLSGNYRIFRSLIISINIYNNHKNQ